MERRGVILAKLIFIVGRERKRERWRCDGKETKEMIPGKDVSLPLNMQGGRGGRRSVCGVNSSHTKTLLENDVWNLIHHDIAYGSSRANGFIIRIC